MKRWKTTWALLGCLTILVPVGNVIADEFRFMPFLRLTQEYNDNIFLDPSTKTSDFITTTSPGIEVHDRTERFEGSLSSRVASLLYADNSRLDHIDQFHNGSGSYLVTPFLTVRGSAQYIVDSRPDRLLLTTGLVLTPAIRHYEAFTGSADYALSEKSVLSASYNYDQYSFDVPNIIGMTANAAQASFIYDLGSMLNNTKGRVSVGYTKYDFQGLQVESYSGTVGASKAINEKLSISVDAGAAQTTSDVNVLHLIVIPPFIFGFTEKETETAWSPIVAASLTYRGEKTTADVSATRQVLPAIGSAGTTDRTSFLFSVSHRLTYELSATLTCQYFQNKSTQSGLGIVSIDSEVLYITPRLRYEFTRDLFLEGSYSFTSLNNRITETTAQRNQFMLRLVIQHRMFE